MPSFPKEKSPNLATPASITLATLQQHHPQAPPPELSHSVQVGLDTLQGDSTLDSGPNIETGVQEDIKEVEIETEDPSHLFWVPFHMHPEIAPNEYNKWLSRHGVDSTGTGAANVLSHRNSAVNRRKSVLSAQYNPEDDDEEEEQAERKKSRRRAVVVGIAEQEEERPKDDFLSGVFSAPLEQMGEPPLKTKTSLRRSTSHTTSAPLALKDATDSNAEDTTVRRAGATGLSRNGPSLMRRSARTKIRRDSTASTDVRHDLSRLRRTVDENGDYAAVTLVDPGPLPLSPPSPPSTLVQLADSVSPLKEEDGKAQETEKPPSKPLKRFVSTLRDSSKPTITTYIEPQLLEQQRKDLEEEADGLSGTPARPSLSNGATAGAGGPKASQMYEAVPVSKVTFPIPPPVKLSQNLLQQPAGRPVSAKPASKQQQHQQNATQKHAVPLLSVPPHSKKSSSWSWLWGKEKGGAGGGSEADPQRSQLTPGMPLSRQHPLLAPSENNGKKTAPSGEATTVIAVKKQSTLSLLFSRNGKSSQAKAQQQSASESKSYNNNGNNNNRHSGPSSGYQYCHDGDCEPGRMPLQIERAVYRLSHAKLANPRRPLHQQVLISNMMFWYLGIAQQEQQQQMQQQQQQPPPPQQQQQQQQQRPQEKMVINGQSNTFGEMDADSKTQQQQQQASRRSNVLHDDKTSNVVGVATEIRDDDGFVHQVVPQQDSNSHARSPSPGVESKRMRGSTAATTTTTTTTTTSNHSPSKRDAVYDEESMIGGGYNGDNILGWSDEEDLEEDEEDEDEEEVEVEEIEYQGVTNGFASLHALPSGPSSTSSPLPVQPLTYSY
ncbi:hypothetical protein BGZ68_008876 [Mortierella alpina]|nr:hypothetical protein BGZ68_008876 [Mortierella alpina]